MIVSPSLFRLLVFTFLVLLLGCGIMKANAENVVTQCSRTTLLDKTNEEIEATSSIDILMTLDERILFWRYIQQYQSYAEYGAGGSTKLACQSNLRHIFTMEADANFLMELFRSSTCLYDAVLQNRIRGEYINIGEVTAFSNPKDRSMENVLWPNYAARIFEANPSPELVLVDGRFRVACALTALLLFQDQEDRLLMFHDFFNRPHYHVVLKYVEVVDCVDTLMVAKRKPGVTDDELKALIDEYNHIYD